jgi:hypothetical protein
MDMKFRYDVLVFAVVFLLSAITYAGLHTSNDISHMMLIDALSNRHTFVICDVPTCGGKENVVDTSQYDNKLFSDRAYGVAVFYLPFSFVAFLTTSPVFILCMVSAMLASLACVYIYRSCKELNCGTYPAIAASLCFGLATIMFKYNAALFSNSLGAFLLSYVLWSIIAKKVNIYTYLAAGYLPAVDYLNIILTGVVFAYLIYEKKFDIKYFILATIPIVMIFVINWHYFNDPLTFTYSLGPHHSYETTSGGYNTSLMESIPALLFGSSKINWGLLTTSPFLIFGMIGLILMRDKIAVLFVLLFIIQFIVYAKFKEYGGGALSDTRYLSTITMCLVIPVAVFLERLASKNKSLEVLFWISVGISLLNSVTALALLGNHCLNNPELIKLPLTTTKSISDYLSCVWKT